MKYLYILNNRHRLIQGGATMKKILLAAFSFLFLILLGIVMCNKTSPPTNTNPTPKNPTLLDLKVTTNDVSGWTLDTFGVYSADSLTHDLDGGDMPYRNNHIVAMIDEGLKYPSGADTLYLGYRFFIMDFGTVANATAMYQSQKSYFDQVPSSAGIAGFDLSEAFADTAKNGGVTAYCHFGKFYFELPFSGFSNHLDALGPAAQFLTLLKSRIL
jgi:hypothetical protein